jgi:hypothetical protein
MAVERAWQPLCIRYGFATKLTLKQDLATAQPGLVPAAPSSVEWSRGMKGDLPIDGSPG